MHCSIRSQGAWAAKAGTGDAQKGLWMVKGGRGGHWNTSLSVLGEMKETPAKHIPEEKTKTRLERHAGLGNTESGWVSCPRLTFCG